MGEIIVRERMYVPAHLLDERAVKKRYHHRFYDEAACRKCPNRPERHNSICNKCEFYTGQNLTYNDVIVGDTQYFGLPLGDRKNIAKHFNLDMEELGVEDLRTRAKRRYPVKMVGFKPYDYQSPAVIKLKKAGYGILKAPPRSGKTPTMLYTGITQFKYRIAIIADQKEFLEQFLDHVVEFTNLPDLQEKHKKKLFGFGKKPEDFENFEIIVCTYQTFLSDKGKKLLKLLNKNFGTVFVDECFPADTKVLLGDMLNYATIAQIVENPLAYSVASYNHSTNKVEAKPVISATSKGVQTVIEIEHEYGVFRCTSNHEIWSHTRQAYVRADSLTDSDLIEIPDDAPPAT